MYHVVFVVILKYYVSLWVQNWDIIQILELNNKPNCHIKGLKMSQFTRFLSRGGGSSPIQKIPLQIYAYLQIFWKKTQCNFQKGKGGEGGVKAVWNFPKKTSIFGETDVP